MSVIVKKDATVYSWEQRAQALSYSESAMGEHKVRPYGFLNLNGKHVDLPYPIKSLNPSIPKSLNPYSYISVEITSNPTIL